jgi:23S rRNA-intervening sequence protein
MSRGMNEPEFEFQKLEVHQRAMDLKPLIDAIIRQLPPGNGDLRSQLRSHERSIRLNIGEGAGKHRPRRGCASGFSFGFVPGSLYR